MKLQYRQMLPCSFRYGEKRISELVQQAEQTTQTKRENQVVETTQTYLFPDGLKLTVIQKQFEKYHACQWLTWFENTAQTDSQIISDVYDCDAMYPMEYDTPVPFYYTPGRETAHIYNPIGSNGIREEFFCKPKPLQVGKYECYAPEGGRSSSGIAPFFDINRQEKGIICAIGWSGQWNAKFERDDTHVLIRTGIEGLRFKLLPGEKIRTSSFVALEYENGQDNGHNAFRRLIKEYFCPIGKPGRPSEGPLCSTFWGGMSSEKMMERLNKMAEHQLVYDYIWVDAGWYGYSTKPCPSEHIGDWGEHTGNWNVNRRYHPDGMQQVVKTIEDMGSRLMLWVEPERNISTTRTATERPEWYLSKQGEEVHKMYNLGNKEARKHLIDEISNLIETLHISCYRQDFNMDPLPFWRENDQPERQGINEIKHIMGLYEYWDALLERFPHLLIDNCASGGRRIDMETLSRSVPLWRSDYQCQWNAPSESTQIHTTGFSWWIPYSGTGVPKYSGSRYDFRSAYSGAMNTSYWGYEEFPFPDVEMIEQLKQRLAEYKRVRPYFSCDFYPLVQPSLDDSSWTAWQYDRPEQEDGIVLVFRRQDSPFASAALALRGLCRDCQYELEDADSGERFTVSGAELLSDGLNIHIPNARESKLYFYSKKPRSADSREG